MSIFRSSARELLEIIGEKEMNRDLRKRFALESGSDLISAARTHNRYVATVCIFSALSIGIALFVFTDSFTYPAILLPSAIIGALTGASFALISRAEGYDKTCRDFLDSVSILAYELKIDPDTILYGLHIDCLTAMTMRKMDILLKEVRHQKIIHNACPNHREIGNAVENLRRLVLAGRKLRIIPEVPENIEREINPPPIKSGNAVPEQSQT